MLRNVVPKASHCTKSREEVLDYVSKFDNTLTMTDKAQASRARRAWREAQGAVTIFLDEADIKVDDARLERPRVAIKRLNTETSPSRTLVSEMMIMAGQIAAEYGEPFPYYAPD